MTLALASKLLTRRGPQHYYATLLTLEFIWVTMQELGNLRHAIRTGDFCSPTSGLAPGYVQANIVIVPASHAADFLAFCLRNPKPCPLLELSPAPGDPSLPKLGDVDIRCDVPKYRVFRDGKAVEECSDIHALWQANMVAFALGCSFSFEEALLADGLEIRNVSEGRNVPMYRSNLNCLSAGPFTAQMVVSMRPFKPVDAIRAIQICTRFPAVHGAPVHFGQPEQIGIQHLDQPDFGEAVTLHDDEVPVFWACGVTPQIALENACLPLAITHSPGHMLITGLRNSQLAVL
jgi:uncharacterized protein YcsI (UPF0317 family)